VRIDEQLRHPFLKSTNPRTGFRLGEDEKVAVEVEQVMVAAPPRPETLMLGALNVGIGSLSTERANLSEKTLAAVGILDRIDDDNCII